MTEEPLLEWVDGKAFAAWIEGRRPDCRSALTDSQQRTLYRLRTEGGCGSLDAIDRICVHLNLHINEIPEWLWTEAPSFGRTSATYSDETKDRALRMIASGTSLREVSEALGVPKATVTTWKRRAA